MTKTRVIAFAGGSASGKSTLCSAVSARLGDRANVLLHDRYYKTVPAERAATWNYDHPRSLDTGLMVEHVRALQAGRAVDVPQYDFNHHARGADTDRLVPRPYLLVEGILVLSDEALRRCADLTVFVHAPADIRLARRIRRDVAERGRTPQSVIERYLSMVRPMHEAWVEPARAQADVVLDGTQPLNELLEEMMARLEVL